MPKSLPQAVILASKHDLIVSFQRNDNIPFTHPLHFLGLLLAQAQGGCTTPMRTSATSTTELC